MTKIARRSKTRRMSEKNAADSSLLFKRQSRELSKVCDKLKTGRLTNLLQGLWQLLRAKIFSRFQKPRPVTFRVAKDSKEAPGYPKLCHFPLLSPLKERRRGRGKMAKFRWLSFFLLFLLSSFFFCLRFCRHKDVDHVQAPSVSASPAFGCPVSPWQKNADG